MSQRGIFSVGIYLTLVFLILTGCKQSNTCLQSLEYVSHELSEGTFDVAIVEFKNGEWKNISKNTKNWGGRFSYKIAVDQNANVISVNSEPIDTDIRDNIHDQVDQNLDKFSETNSHPHIFFEIQTFDLTPDSKNESLTEMICRIHDIVSAIKKEKISNGFDKELVDRVLYERYIVYDYNQLYGNENTMFLEKQED